MIAVRYAPVIKKVTTIAGWIALLSAAQLVLEQAGYVPQTGYTEVVFAVSGLIFTGGMSLTMITDQLRGVVEPLRGSHGTLLTGSAANSRHLGSNPGHSPPYKTASFAAEGRIAQGTKLVRVFRPGVSRPRGSWVMSSSEIEGLSPEQIAEKYALDYIPTRVVDVNANGLLARTGVVGENFGRSGTGIRIQLLDSLDLVRFVNELPLPLGGF